MNNGANSSLQSKSALRAHGPLVLLAPPQGRERERMVEEGIWWRGNRGMCTITSLDIVTPLLK